MNKERVICCCGNYRSGSTLIYMIASNLLKAAGCQNYELTKLHEQWMLSKKTNNDIFIYSYRDVRDVMASFCQKDKCDFNTFRDHSGGERHDVVEFIKFMIRYDESVRHFHHEKPNHCLILRYETEIIGKTYELVEKIRKFISIPDNVWSAKIAEKFSFEKNKEFAVNLSELDQTTKLHPNHLKDGKIAKYNEVFKKEEIDQMNGDPKISNWLIKNGYKI